MGARGGLAVLALLLILPGCAANMSGAPPRAKSGAIRGILHLPAPSGASAMASVGGGAHASAAAETPLDAVIYIESVPAFAPEARSPAPKPGDRRAKPESATAGRGPSGKIEASPPARAKTAVAEKPPAGGAKKNDPTGAKPSEPRGRKSAGSEVAIRTESEDSRVAHPLDARRAEKKARSAEKKDGRASEKKDARAAEKKDARPAESARDVRVAENRKDEKSPKKSKVPSSERGSAKAEDRAPASSERTGSKPEKVAARTEPKRSPSPATRGDAAGGEGQSESAERVRMGQSEHRFVPRVLPVALGTTIHFKNRDRVWHNVFSISPAKRFDIGKYPPRQSRAVTFDAPGVVQLYSDIDPAMAGFVFVVPSPFFTQPDASGAFALPGLPAGGYTLKVWHPTLGRITRRVELNGDGDANVSLAY